MRHHGAARCATGAEKRHVLQVGIPGGEEVRVVEDKLLRLWEKMQSTVVLVSHDLAEAVALADRVVVMSARPGRIAADIAIDLPRPRSVTALQSMSDYHNLYSRLWRELERATGPVMGA